MIFAVRIICIQFTHRWVQPGTRSLSKLAEGHGIKSMMVDGNKVDDVYETSLEACINTKGGGPVFLEIETYRWREHGPNYDNNIGYRTDEEFKQWKKRTQLSKSPSNSLMNK